MMHLVGTRDDARPVELHDLERLYRQEAARLLGMLCAFLGSRSEAEDVLQESFVRVQRAWERIEDPAKAAGYLRSTAFNLARSGLRRRRRRPDPPGTRPLSDEDGPARGAPVPTPEDGLALREDQRAVLAALARLPSRQRACVVLRYYGGEGIDAIGATLGISANSVKTHLRRALAALEIELEDLR